MGNKDSKPEIVHKEIVQKVYVNTDEAERALILCQLEEKTKELQKEVKKFKQEFPAEEVQQTIATKEDVLVLRYKELEDITKILGNVTEIFDGFPGASFIVDTAQKLIVAMRSTDELKEIVRWQSNRVIRNIDGQSVGIEVHYKVNMTEEDEKKSFYSKAKKDIVLMVAYKSIAHVMNTPAAQVPSWDKLKSIKF